MANVLHRTKQSLDAAILVHAALETTVEFDICYFTLGNIYAVSKPLATCLDVSLNFSSYIISFPSPTCVRYDNVINVLIFQRGLIRISY